MSTTSGAQMQDLATTGIFCFDPAAFAEESFDPALFLAAAKELTPLEVLRDHLRSYQRGLKEELYNVINRDIADYLDLSSKLSGLESEVLELRAPLQEVSINLEEAKTFVATASRVLRDKVHERDVLRSSRQTLEKRIRFLRSLSDVEILLGLRVSLRAETKLGAKDSTRPTQRLRELSEAQAASAEHVARHCATLERAAHAWTSLSANLPCFSACVAVEEAANGDAVTAEAVTKRLTKVEKTLVGHLTAALRAVLCPKNLVSVEAALGEEKGDFQVNKPALRAVLRSLVAMGRGDEAEKQAGRLVMLPFMDIQFTQGRLDGGSRGSCSGLKGMFAACLAHVRRNLGQTLETAEDLMLEMVGGPAAQTEDIPLPTPPLDLVCNGVWKPVQHIMVTRLSSVFVPGIASIVHSNYVISMKFLEDLALIAGPQHQRVVRRRLHAHPATREFQGRWNLPVYFHLRFTEVSGAVDKALEEALKQKDPTEDRRSDDVQTSDAFTFTVFGGIKASLELLWAPEVYLAPLAQQLFRFTLQIIGRFRLWLEDVFEGVDKKRTGNLVRPDSPLVLVSFCWDLHRFSSTDTTVVLQRHILAAMARDHDSRTIEKVVAEGLSEAMAPLRAHVERGWRTIIAQLAAKCITVLQAVRGITATYRMTNKRPPEKASIFVQKILQPVRSFESEISNQVPSEEASVWRLTVAVAVTEKYTEVTREVLSSVDQMEDALKKRRLRTGRSTGTAGGSMGMEAQQGLSDSDKIKLQLLLDVSAFAVDLSSLAGCEPLELDTYRDLLAAVAAALPALAQARAELKAAIMLPEHIEAHLKQAAALREE